MDDNDKEEVSIKSVNKWHDLHKSIIEEINDPDYKMVAPHGYNAGTFHEESADGGKRKKNQVHHMDGTDSVIDMKYDDVVRRDSFILKNKPKIKSGSCSLSCKLAMLCCFILIGVLLVILVPTSKVAYFDHHKISS